MCGTLFGFWYISLPCTTRGEFFLCDVVFQGFNASKIHLFICCFEQLGINAEKFKKSRIRFNSDVHMYLLPARHQYF